ncbi:MAG: hypothetical protein Q7V57_00715 [Actinomycetota bacterium]|nr:hypothetical protein [Actinomycetota bacterium]
MDDLRALKRAVFVEIGERCADLTVAGAPVRIRRSADALRIETDLPDGSRGLVHLATIKQGLPVGAFAIDPSALVYGGFVRGVLQQLPVPGSRIAGLGAILCATASSDRGGSRTFAVHGAGGPAVDTVVAAVRNRFVPLLAAFSGDWAAAFAHTLAHPPEVDRPYSTATVLALLAGRPTEVVDERAAADPRYWDRDAALAVPGWRERVQRLVSAAAPR